MPTQLEGRGVKKKVRKYWYKFFYSECVLCGAHHEYKERRYTKKPKGHDMRHCFDQYVCGNHF